MAPFGPDRLRHVGSKLITPSGVALLEGLHPGIQARADDQGAGWVLGVHVDAPPAALVDVQLGQVKQQNGRQAAHGLAANASSLQTALGDGLVVNASPALVSMQLACTRFVALARAKLYWMVPAWGTCAGDLPVETQLLLTELADGRYGLLLPLIDGGSFRGSLRPPAPGQGDTIKLRMESGDESVTANSFTAALYAAAGVDPFELLDAGVAAAARLSGRVSRPRIEKVVPASLDVFGWCSWDA